MKSKVIRDSHTSECGAALVTVLLITALILTATIAMLTALGAGARETTDVLSETKAYYAAESGIQAAINRFRNDSSVTYQGVAGDNTVITSQLYDWPTTGTKTRAVVGTTAASYDPNQDTAYSLSIVDPDSSGTSTTFSTAGSFSQTDLSLPFQTTRVFSSGTATTTISFTGVSSTITHPANSLQIGSFTITNTNGGVAITDTYFRIDYQMTLPRTGTVTIWGKINAAAAGASTTAQFNTQSYPELGNTIKLCSASGQTSSCTLSATAITPGAPANIYAYIGPMAPYRLVVTSTGYGPNSASKNLEAVLQRNLLNGFASGAATTMIGTSTPPAGGLPYLFEPGTSNGVTYSGGDCASANGCVPSFGLTDPTILSYVLANPPHNDPANMSPAPELLDTNSIPVWQQTPVALDSLVDQFRTAAQHSGTYYVSPGGTLNNPGNYAAGTGITFCEGSCKVGGDGGGVLVVTGLLTNVGGFNFKGLIIVTGEEGWERSGGGGGSIIGNVVIAPYNKRTYVPENLSATFLAPRYSISGGGTSDVIYGDISQTFDNTSGISDIVAGVAEK